ncbi:hypothetical protein K3495_g6281 [Podosphaera aphanis]|nr:hypothetical protein K3495_g6281 [Podosphaera aphanis]
MAGHLTVSVWPGFVKFSYQSPPQLRIIIGFCYLMDITHTLKMSLCRYPLDLAPLSVVKSMYRQEIQALASIDDAAPVKKERFITSYHKARIEGLSGRVIRAGWRASGLCPYTPELVLQSNQVQARRAATPSLISPNNLSHEVPMTPKRSQDLYRSQKLLERDGNLGRSTRYLLAKAGKAISRGNTEIAQLRASNARLQVQPDQHRINKPKKRI